MTYRYFDERMETLAPDVMRTVQDHRLRWQFRRCWDGSAWYRERFEAAGVTPETFKGLADIGHLPMMARQAVVDSGKSARQVAPDAGLAGRRLDTWNDRTQEHERRSRLWAAEWTYLESPRPVEPPQPWHTPAIRHAAHLSAWRNAKVRTFALSISGIGYPAAYECVHRYGRHWIDDHFLAEIVQPTTHEPISDGIVGELVVTDLVREAYPLIRLRTGLKRAITRDGCPCGRTTSKVWTATQLRAAQSAPAPPR